MQTQQQINENVHVKVQCDNEFRRFVLAEVTYQYLADKIGTLLGFAPSTVLKLSYLDDENDWVLFATDSELQYAVTLSKSPLKISVQANEAPSEGNSTVPVEASWRRCGRGGVRGGRGGRRGEFKGERIDAKIARLTERHAVLTAKIIEGDLPQEKVRGIEWRLSHIQNKIDSLKAKKETQLNDTWADKKEAYQETAPVESETANDETEEEGDDLSERPQRHWNRRGGCGHGHGRWGGRGGCPRNHFGGEGHPHPPPPFGPHHFGGEGHPHPFGCLPPHPFGGEEEHPHPPFPFHPPHHHFGGEHHPHHHRGGRRGEKGGRGCEGRKPAFVRVCAIPEGKAAFDRLHAAKEGLVTARQEKASPEVIMAKIEELKEAKAAWREIKVALWKEKKEQKEHKRAGCPKKHAK